MKERKFWAKQVGDLTFPRRVLRPGSRIRRVWTQIKRSKWGFKKISGGMFTFSGGSPVRSWPRHFLRPGLNLNHASEEKWEKSDECPRRSLLVVWFWEYRKYFRIRRQVCKSWIHSTLSIEGCRVSKFWHFINLQSIKNMFLELSSHYNWDDA